LSGRDDLAPFVLRQLGELADEGLQRRPHPPASTSGDSSRLHAQRIARTRLHLERSPREDLGALLEHRMEAAGCRS
jgi:hypothetical protein